MPNMGLFLFFKNISEFMIGSHTFTYTNTHPQLHPHSLSKVHRRVNDCQYGFRWPCGRPIDFVSGRGDRMLATT